MPEVLDQKTGIQEGGDEDNTQASTVFRGFIANICDMEKFLFFS